MKQPHTETGIDHTDGEQNTGNHPADGTTGKVPGGVRAGAQNVEAPAKESAGNSRAKATQEQLDESISVNGPAEQTSSEASGGR